MSKNCLLCNNKVKDNKDYCWVHNDKPRKMNKTKKKKQIKEMLEDMGKKIHTGYKAQLYKFRDDIMKSYELKRRKFSKIDTHHKAIMKIWRELAEEEYQIIPNKMKAFMNKKDG